MLSAAGAWALPNCPSDRAFWSNCVGTDVNDVGTYVGEFKENKRVGQGTFTWFDGDKYVGEWKGDKINGLGTFTYGSKSEWFGDKYVGEFKDDMFHGQGTYTSANGEKYVGEYRDDKRNGQGTYIWPDGDKYVGEVKDGKFHGQGTYTFADGTLEEGIWENNEFKYAKKAEPLKASVLQVAFTQLSQSQRRQIQSNLSRLSLYASSVDGVYGKRTAAALTSYNKMYLNDSDLTKAENVGKLMASVLAAEDKKSDPPVIGDTLSKCPSDISLVWLDCYGEYSYGDGEKYVGQFKHDKRDGQGTYTFANGDKYIGAFKDNSRNGQGTYIYANGDKYIGEFKDGMFHSHGTFFYSNGDLYMGAWVKDLRQGRGDLKLKNGDRYVGDFSGDEPSGTGTLYFKNGDRYHGGFRVGKFHGQGTFTHADGTVEEGTWENDQLKYPKEAEPPPVTEVKPQDDEVLEASSGSGFAVSSDGYVITNNHVIEGCQEVAVYEGGRAVPVTVITYDLQNDLALLKGDFTPKTVFALSGEQPELLQDVYVAGYPFGNEISSSIKVTKGIISSLTGIGNNFSNIQIDAALQVGNSGGPILDEWGNVVGVAVSKLDAKYMYDNFGTIPENTNFGIKANVVRNVLDSNGVSSPSPSTSEITKSELGTRITGGTYYVSCLMTLAQIEVLRTKKVMFENLD